MAIAAGKDGVYLIWSTPDSVLVLTPGNKQPHAMGMKGSYPAIAALPNGGALTAWESEGKIAIQLVK